MSLLADKVQADEILSFSRWIARITSSTSGFPPPAAESFCDHDMIKQQQSYDTYQVIQLLPPHWHHLQNHLHNPQTPRHHNYKRPVLYKLTSLNEAEINCSYNSLLIF